MRLSLFLRAVLISAATAGLVAALLSVQAARLTEAVAAQALARFSAEVSAGFAVSQAAAIRFRKPEDMAQKAADLMARNPDSIRQIIAFDARGDVFLVLPSASATDTAQLGGLAAQALRQGQGVLGADGLDRAEVVPGKDGAPAGGVAIDWSDATLRTEIAADTMAIRLQALVAFLVLSALAAWLLRSAISLPLLRLGAAMGRVAAADFETEVTDADRRDEIGGLARDLNQMRLSLGAADAAAARAAQAREQQSQVVEDLRRTLADLSQGRLSSRIDVPFPPEYEALRADLNRLAETLSFTIRDFAAAAQRIRGGTDGLSRSTEDLARRTENQAATLEQPVAAVAELTGALQAAAQDTRQVAEGIGRTRTQAVDGQAIVQKAVLAMSEIRRSSDQITRIIGVIDDIAFQTNLLALNAGVEAARAGEAGRGFSVVASEVRALAQRTSESAREIKDLIQGAADEVIRGVDLVDRSGDALTRIAAEVDTVVALAEGLAGAIANQSSGLNEVSIGLNQLDQVTQQNAGMVDQTAATQRGIRDEAETLGSLVAQFQVAADAPADALAWRQAS